MVIEGGGLIPSKVRGPLNVLLYVFIVGQFLVLLNVMRQAEQHNSLPFRAFFLPFLYLGPAIIGFAFRQHIRALLEKGLLSREALNGCGDWITCLLCMVYGSILEFRLLH